MTYNADIDASTTSDPPVRFDGVSRRFGETTAVDDLTFQIEAGTITALLGLNGAGKTTAIRMLLGLLAPTKGRVSCFGLRPAARAVRLRLAAVLQQAGLPDDLTVQELMFLFSSYYPAPVDFGTLTEQLNLSSLLSRRYGRLSGGQQRLVQFAVALIGDPRLLVLDEPTTGLDPDARRTFWSHLTELANKERTIVMTTHYLEEADRLAQRVLLIHRGHLIADASPAQLKATTAAKQIRCRTELAQSEVAGLVGVIRVERSGAETSIDTLQAEATLRALLAVDPGVRDLQVTGGDLESAIRVLTTTTEGAA